MSSLFRCLALTTRRWRAGGGGGRKGGGKAAKGADSSSSDSALVEVLLRLLLLDPDVSARSRVSSPGCEGLQRLTRRDQIRERTRLVQTVRSLRLLAFDSAVTLGSTHHCVVIT
eukprot:3223079-Rhodomonas_salina.1